MKALSILIFIFYSFNLYSQTSEINGRFNITEPYLNYYDVQILLKQGDGILMKSRIDSLGNFIFKNVPEGFYALIFDPLGFRQFITDSFFVFHDSTKQVIFNYPPPCRYIYEEGMTPKCIYGHSNKIIPIIYGLPLPKTMKKAKKGLLKLGGCIVSGCDPHFYCKVHKIEF
jgi:hypothetical protein